MSGSANNSSFVDLNAFESVRADATRTSSSIIKSTAVSNAGVAKIEIIEGDQGAPTIQVQREGDRIKQIEFICSCGRSAHLDLEYDEE
ncbi:MAG: hypothetical protein NTU47_16160 [Ignavibacteriales bacterium]|nr:hypothetical protein [Ignavibacteriales bacterium]